MNQNIASQRKVELNTIIYQDTRLNEMLQLYFKHVTKYKSSRKHVWAYTLTVALPTDSLYLYKYLSITKLFLNRDFV